ncbi:MAG: hypothetical protein LBT94_04345 [Prevotellaceae bacterium]|jgi:hypothetical protein|nr:hypothetical protein [Prevotellaceae bacterium]
MKTTSIMLAALLIGGSQAIAQTSSTSTAGTFATEIYVNPFVRNPFSLIDGIRGRYFLSDKLAIRADLGLSYKSSSENQTHINVTPAVEGVAKHSLFSFNLAPGAEYHFATYENVSLYAGAAFKLRFDKASQEITNDKGVKGDKETKSGKSDFGSSNFTFGLQAFTGVDVSVYKNLYLGAELGLQYSMNKPSEVKTTSTIAGKSTTTTTKNHVVTSNLGFYVSPAFRLGWRF